METFTLNVTSEEIQIISAGLSELPFKHVAKFIANLQEQLDNQINKNTVETPPTKGE